MTCQFPLRQIEKNFVFLVYYKGAYTYVGFIGYLGYIYTLLYKPSTK
jgi:hypothetical protein